VNYAVVVFDENERVVAKLENATTPTYTRAKNAADRISFSVPKGDPKISEIKVGRRFEILRTIVSSDTLEMSGYVTECGWSGELFEVGGFTEDIIFSWYLTPAVYGYPLYSEYGNLRDFFSKFTSSYVIERVKQNWADYMVELVNAEYVTDPAWVILEKNGGDDDSPYFEGGYITLRFEKEDDERWERFRWSGDYDEATTAFTTVQFRQSNTEGGGSFSAPEPGAEPDVVGLVIPDPNLKYLDVRVNLITEDTDLSPRLFAVEVIRTKPIRELVGVSFVPTGVESLALGVVTPKVETDEGALLDVLIDASNLVDWQFRVRRRVLEVSNDFGVDRTNEFALVES
jgi:hypothetical protein